MKFKTNAAKVICTITADIVVFAILILTFAWFHHARPHEYGMGTELPTQPPTPTIEVTVPAETVHPTVTEEVPTETATAEPTGLLGGKYADKFTDGEIVIDDNSYRSNDVCIELTSYSKMINGYLIAYYVADIYIQDIDSFRCENAQTDNNKERIETMAERTGAIFACSGDYWMKKEKGLVIRNGILYRDRLNTSQDICVIFSDGTMKTYYAGAADMDEILNNYPLHAWSFGPVLLENGQAIESGFNCNDYVAGRHPRCAIGYYEPGHYCAVIVDGRTEGYSYGMTMAELSQLMFELGCTQAYNLDGGMTAMMWYNGSLYSKPCENGRANTDMFYIVEPNNGGNNDEN